MIQKKLPLIILTLVWGLIWLPPAWAGQVLERIEKTGVLRAGTRKDAIPFGYVNEKGEWVGYSVDILELIRAQLEQELKKPISLELVEVNPDTRFAKIKDNSIDIECGSTTFTWEREKTVDFSLSYFPGGTQMLVKKGSNLATVDSLIGKKIGVIQNTTNAELMQSLQPQAQFVAVKDRLEGFALLEKGEIDGFASDGILLEGLRLQASNPENYQLVPEYPYAIESYGCILPQDESRWRDLVNYTLVQYMEGLVSDNPQAVEIYERHFGETGTTPYPREIISNYFQGIINTLEWIPLSGRY